MMKPNAQIIAALYRLLLASSIPTSSLQNTGQARHAFGGSRCAEPPKFFPCRLTFPSGPWPCSTSG